ncbi:cyclopropane-fatty-acyl-phospholipid synthase [Aliivibrio sp. S4TY2]|uniref:SAM-dependent methyltransferase n=1 Tax=unclassified Aliivibrio TaxID=2645654 RepID=UPI002378556C|nr:MULTISPECIES: cyclopropane-fatty-acyl-phospholipid synthase family protein [unclassified Aliivibrio]MDD9156338.1 cyclopropane-fatty-acyl-phospholipid synthase [Aliivibrio sp. S4TY2]MDD9160685.1 cyclopropane-fatty-acyl-phospholipid synthase [Aliivibrio sp. S4TY1]MDD9164046.1 cyclopropane-fatty-acyl-phospholipid synthase [Aliivibrio sp. S4MY2]MDD9167980.1 cyclopropane-fatty-acyl-phospholipid synthase [Aliivibrio sp. S4MY4]MDD9185242.1 cyclopropane-fatty-acyl-phospholipid synthase [Aliivibrio 
MLNNQNVSAIQKNETKPVSWIDKTTRKVLLDYLAKMTQASLTINDELGQVILGNKDTTLAAVVEIHNMEAYRKILFGGGIGASEAYVAGWWTSPNLTKVIQVLGREQGVLDRVENRFSKIIQFFDLLNHKRNKNTEQGSKKNILAHYDLGNEMYKTFLDKEMLYSSAIYPNANANLEEAQLFKLQTICERLELKPGETLLEIGTGWGALAIYAAQNYGVKVTTTTISDAQYEYAEQKVKSLGLEDSITLLKQDYRTLEGQYDKLVSIEMIEAVGHEYLSTFFDVCSRHLKPEGKMLIQAITISDQRYDSYRKSVDFIQRYIFPGGCLPSVSVMANKVAENTDMVITSLNDIGLDYAKTLNHWYQRFDKSAAELKQMGYGDDFIRLWKFYLCYCEGGFLERKISTVHLVAAKPQHGVC